MEARVGLEAGSGSQSPTSDGRHLCQPRRGAKGEESQGSKSHHHGLDSTARRSPWEKECKHPIPELFGDSWHHLWAPQQSSTPWLELWS